jgi:competence protein ComEC
MPALLLTFASGILITGFFSRLPPLSSLLLLIPLLLLLMVIRRRLLLLMFTFAVGASWGVIYGHYAVGNILSDSLAGEDIWVTGRIVELPLTEERRQRFLVDIEEASIEGVELVPFPSRVQISWYETPTHVKAGERWRLLVRLKQPRSFVNPGGFDYEGWLLRRGIGAVGYVRAHSANQLLQNPAAFDRHHWRYRLQQWLLDTTQSPRRGVLLALLIGDRSLIEPEQWQDLQQTGTNHLVAISGLHVGFVALLGLWLGKGLGRLLSSFLHGFPVAFSACFCASGLALFYSTMAGFSLPTQRALIMVLVAQVAYLLQRSFRPRDGLLLAFVLVVVRDPLAAFDPGFWLSFAAVAVLLLAFVGRATPRALQIPGTSLVYSQWVVFIGLVLPLALLINSVALLAPLANLIAIPLVTFLVVPPLLLAAALQDLLPGLSHWLVQVADLGLAGLFWWLELLLGLGRLRLNPPVIFNAHSLWLAALGLLLLLLPLYFPGRRMGYGVVLIALLLPGTPRAPLKVTVMDVGQGLAVVVQTPHHTLVYDTGPTFGENFEAGGGIILPYLRQQRVRSLDAVVVSHNDNDHAGGVRGLLAGMSVRRLWWGQTPVYLIPELIDSWSCHTEPDTAWQWDEVRFRLVATPGRFHTTPNDSSCVLLVEYKEHAILLPGDITRNVEQYLAGLDDLPARLTLLLAAHHGSKTSSSASFVNHFQPEIVVYSTGYSNRYGHPHSLVSARFNAVGSRELNTATSGALEFIWTAEGEQKIIEFRQQQRRYWYQ